MIRKVGEEERGACETCVTSRTKSDRMLSKYSQLRTCLLNKKSFHSSVRPCGPRAMPKGAYGDFGVRIHCGGAPSYSRRSGPRLSVRGEPLLVPIRGPLYLPCKAAPQQDPDLCGPLSERAPRLQSKLCKGTGVQRAKREGEGEGMIVPGEVSGVGVVGVVVVVVMVGGALVLVAVEVVVFADMSGVVGMRLGAVVVEARE